MIQSFADRATQDLFEGADSKAARTFSRTLWPAIRRKLDGVSAAAAIQDLRVPPGNRLEALKGAAAGRYSIRVNEQYRVTFRWEGGHAFEVRCEDYH